MKIELEKHKCLIIIKFTCHIHQNTFSLLFFTRMAAFQGRHVLPSNHSETHRQTPDKVFSLSRQEYPPILMSGEMLSHPGGWDKPIPEVIHLWRHRKSTPNNLEKSRLGCVFNIFCTILGKNEKNNQTPHWGRDSGIPSSWQRFATSTTRQASSWIANLRHSEGIPSSLPQCGVRFY